LRATAVSKQEFPVVGSLPPGICASERPKPIVLRRVQLRGEYMELLQELLTEELKDLLHAENQLVKALPKMAKAAKDADLRAAFEDHLEQTKGHVERLKEAFEMMDEKPKAKPCKGMAGLVEEGQEVITEGKQMEEAPADLALIGAAQRVEHYEIAAYGTARAIAEQMDRQDIVKLLSQTLAEEEEADQLLTKLAQPLLEEAGQAGEQESEEEEADLEEEEV
jgi:Mn-containing catalase